MLASLRSFLRALAHRHRFEGDLAEELREHILARVDDLVAQGMTQKEATRRASLEFGSAERVREECREARGLRWPDQMRRNVRFAWRLLRKDRAFAVTAVTTLAVCIGATTAVFSLVDAVFLRPLPYPEPNRLVQVVVSHSKGSQTWERTSQTGHGWVAVRDALTALRPAAQSSMLNEISLAAEGHVESVQQQRVSAMFFDVLGVPPQLGRGFSADEDRPGGPAAVVIANDLWRAAFHADTSIIGRTVFLRGEPTVVVGVMPQGFRTGVDANVWTPLRATTTAEGEGANYQVIGRLRPGVTVAEADAQAAAIDPAALGNIPQGPGVRPRLQVVPLQRAMARGIGVPVLLLWGSVGLVLLIGCSNVAGLLLARSAQRAHEIGTRLALGGGRGVIVGQLLTESLVLAGLGGIAGVGVAYVVLAAIGQLTAETLGVWQGLHLDLRVLAASLVVSASTGVVFGLFPACRATRVDVRRALLEGGDRSVAGSSRSWPRRVLLVSQIALGCVLLISATLLIRSFSNLNSQPPGFNPENVITASVSLLDARYQTAEKVNALFDTSLSRIRQIPEVAEAGVMLTLPYERALNLGFTPADARGVDPLTTDAVYVTPGAFDALQMSLWRGRQFLDTDNAASSPVVMVNLAFARRYYQGREIVGQRVRFEGTVCEVIGVVRDVPQRSVWGGFGPLAPVPTMYLPAAQMEGAAFSIIHTWFSPRWVVRTRAASPALPAAMQQALAASDPLLAMGRFRHIDQIRAATLAPERLEAQSLGGLALIALVLSFVGTYGLVAHGVAERRHEVGIRLALGATLAQVIRALTVPTLWLAGAGILCGLGVAALAVPLLRRGVWGIGVFDPLTFAGVAAGVLLTAAVASLLPTLGLGRLDAARVLRDE